MKRALSFAATMAALIGLTGWVGLVLLFPTIGDAGVKAVVVSGGVAFSVQFLTFGIARAFAPTNLMAGWGMGMIIRFLTVILHGFIGAPILGLPVGAALVSLAAFLFLTSLVEPFFLGWPDDRA